MMVSLLVAACAISDDDAGGQSSAQHIDPRGNDSPGNILVKLPDGAPAVEDSRYYVSPDNMVKVGTPITNLPVGNKVVQLVSGWFSSSASMSVAPGQTSTLTTALLGLKNTDGPRTLGLAAANESGNTYNLTFRSAAVPAAFADGAHRVALFDSTFPIKWGLLDGVSVKVDMGGNALVDVKDVANRRITRIKTTKGDYPTACNGKNGWSVGSRQPNRGGYISTTNWDGNEIDLGISLENDGFLHIVKSDIWTDYVPVPSGERGAGPLAWTIGVIDVDDVLINDAQPRVPGSWAVFTADPKTGQRTSNNLLSCTPPTKTGTPLPPGHYRIEVFYNTVEVGQKTDVHIIDI